ncbi:hypothetical protein KY312_01565, partial [Candidatus Woesearchaeota archaeon]|nr:hypothetical protein [Candidatus Woesearchaeota archaeon]
SIYSHTGTFATMAFNGHCLKPLVRRLMKSYKRGDIFDNHFWDDIQYRKHFTAKEMQVICMKGMPGRHGCIFGHHKLTKPKRRFINDIDFKMLKLWVGKDAQEYIKICNEMNSMCYLVNGLEKIRSGQPLVLPRVFNKISKKKKQ